MNPKKPPLPNRTAQHSDLVEQEGKRNDIGFGAKPLSSQSRLVNQDGSFNVVRVNGNVWERLNVYNRLITMRWLPFLSLIIAAYLTANTFFAGVYMLAGPESFVGVDDAQLGGPFWKCFFFSAQTLTTVGYGHISPNSFLISSIAAFESMIGLLSFALATGLLYGRFSRPVAHIRFSKVAVVAPYLDVNAWMFRIVNTRPNQLVNLEVAVSLSRLETKPDGTLSRRYYSLPLERNKVAFFPTNWTLVHPITNESPLYGCTLDDLKQSDSEFMISFQALDDTFVQMVHTRFSYWYDEVRWGHKFRSMVAEDQDTMQILDLTKLDETEEAALNQ